MEMAHSNLWLLGNTLISPFTAPTVLVQVTGGVSLVGTGVASGPRPLLVVTPTLPHGNLLLLELLMVLPFHIQA